MLISCLMIPITMMLLHTDYLVLMLISCLTIQITMLLLLIIYC